MDREAIKEGFKFEQVVCDLLDGKKVPGSGNQWYSKSDVEAHGLLISCKSEIDRTWSRTRKQLSEAIEYSSGTGKIPILAIEDKVMTANPDRLILMRLDDFARALSGDATSIPLNSGMSKGELKRQNAEIPQLLRE